MEAKNERERWQRKNELTRVRRRTENVRGPFADKRLVWVEASGEDHRHKRTMEQGKVKTIQGRNEKKTSGEMGKRGMGEELTRGRQENRKGYVRSSKS